MKKWSFPFYLSMDDIEGEFDVLVDNIEWDLGSRDVVNLHATFGSSVLFMTFLYFVKNWEI